MKRTQMTVKTTEIIAGDILSTDIGDCYVEAICEEYSGEKIVTLIMKRRSVTELIGQKCDKAYFDEKTHTVRRAI
ncbi:hypothetical protein UFOVP1305_91 [uncultured Caudovirales phage]|uniref:Uncharacterized protein n=1 Tax=uncultured Caudovirales phage TaxID=2100421 RepID=A0A6J5PEG5_9CAUD|nr:hypothetical protein UFOVP896_36 [uncultured Caudovirales phage]CAB4198434.1 hypothetical protein UFOVP1305_91 [uncultured Caudovirales phage]